MGKVITRNINQIRIKKINIYQELGIPMIKVVWERRDQDNEYFDEGIIVFHGDLPTQLDLDNNPIPLPNNYVEMTQKQLNRVKQTHKQIQSVLGRILLDEDNPDEEEE